VDLKTLIDVFPRGTARWLPTQPSASSSPNSRSRLDLCIYEILQHHWPGEDRAREFLDQCADTLGSDETGQLIQSRIIDAVMHWK